MLCSFFNDINTIMNEAYEWFKTYIPEEDIVFYFDIFCNSWSKTPPKVILEVLSGNVAM